MVRIRDVVKEIRLTYINKGIHEALDTYLQYIPFEFSEWQLDDLHLVITYSETALIRSRRGGKSRDLTVIAVFLSLLEYQVIWRAPFNDQLKQAGMYFKQNPFVKKISMSVRHEVDISYSPSIEIGSLTVGKVASLGCDALIYDEGGKVDQDKIMYQNYLYSRAMIAASQKPKFLIHGTTPCIYTAIEEVVNYLPPEQVSTHPYTDTTWISPEFIEEERRQHMNDPWYISQEYLCMFVVRGGAVFENIKTYEDLGLERPTEWTHMGVDFNGIGHMCVRIAFDKKYIYCAPDVWIKEVTEIKDYLSPRMQVEVEDGGANLGYVNQCMFGYAKQLVNEEFQSRRLAELCKRTIVVDNNLNPGLIKNLREAVYDERKPIIKKRNDQHYLDGLMHAIKTFSIKPRIKRIVTNIHGRLNRNPNYVPLDNFGQL